MLPEFNVLTPFLYLATSFFPLTITWAKVYILSTITLNHSLQPKVVTDTDETELARQLERLERENAEVDGDDDAEEMEAKTED